jgi:uncharacterized membrane protein YphA (DoxX/SURF4 family)
VCSSDHRPLGHNTALLYTLGTAIIGHHFWTKSGMERVEAEINFFKNVSIMAGLLLPYLTGREDTRWTARLSSADR